jgi:hypothetical protein
MPSNQTNFVRGSMMTGAKFMVLRDINIEKMHNTMARKVEAVDQPTTYRLSVRSYSLWQLKMKNCKEEVHTAT